MANASERAERRLLSAHENIYVLRHPNHVGISMRNATLYWSHHEKLVVVDQSVAFVGGIDLCDGRFDQPSYDVSDPAIPITLPPIAADSGVTRPTAARGTEQQGTTAYFAAAMQSHPAGDGGARTTPHAWHDDHEFSNGCVADSLSHGFRPLWRTHQVIPKGYSPPAGVNAMSLTSKRKYYDESEETKYADTRGIRPQRIRKFHQQEPTDSTTAVDREVWPRLPWHDVAMAIGGSAAVDVSFHFIERWNHHRVVRGKEKYAPVLMVRSDEAVPWSTGSGMGESVRPGTTPPSRTPAHAAVPLHSAPTPNKPAPLAAPLINPSATTPTPTPTPSAPPAEVVAPPPATLTEMYLPPGTTLDSNAALVVDDHNHVVGINVTTVPLPSPLPGSSRASSESEHVNDKAFAALDSSKSPGASSSSSSESDQEGDEEEEEKVGPVVPRPAGSSHGAKPTQGSGEGVMRMSSPFGHIIDSKPSDTDGLVKPHTVNDPDNIRQLVEREQAPAFSKFLKKCMAWFPGRVRDEEELIVDERWTPSTLIPPVTASVLPMGVLRTPNLMLRKRKTLLVNALATTLIASQEAEVVVAAEAVAVAGGSSVGIAASNPTPRPHGPPRFDDSFLGDPWSEWQNPGTHDCVGGADRCWAQVLRSCGEWSVGVPRECSIATAMATCIRNAEHFVYIENQFFISGNGHKSVVNRVGDALLERIEKAINENQTFRVIIVVPAYPEGCIDKNSGMRAVAHYQYTTISHGKRSILGTLKKKFPQVDPFKYISFYSLRSAGLNPNREAITEQVYVHSKVMIVDDRVALIGSANINDRSLRGNRDSEMAILIGGGKPVASTMAGNPWVASEFVLRLRFRLWCAHLGLPPSALARLLTPAKETPTSLPDADALHVPPPSAVPIPAVVAAAGVNGHYLPADPRPLDIRDPACDKTYRAIWMESALQNTEWYETFFPTLKRFTDDASRKPPLLEASWVENGLPPRGTLVWASHAFHGGKGLKPKFSILGVFVNASIFM